MKTTTAIVIAGIATIALVYFMAEHESISIPPPGSVIPPPPAANLPPPEFPPDSGIMGKVFIGPRCPVQRDPPDPNCADAPYKTTIDVRNQNGTNIMEPVPNHQDGTFTIRLRPGHYVLVPEVPGGGMLPRCGSQEVEVFAHKFQTVTLSCDTGIR